MSRHYLLDTLQAALSFQPAPSVVAWLEKNISLPPEMSPAQPGPFRVINRPQMAPILECFHPSSGVRKLTVTAGAQWAKTTIGTLGFAYLMRHAPGSLLGFANSADWIANEIGSKRLMALINHNRVLRELKPALRDNFSKRHLLMQGMPVDLVGANSSTALAGSTRRYVWGEEAAKIEHQTRENPEGHPIRLAFDRTKAFRGNDLHYLCSTPNIRDNMFWECWEDGDQTIFPLRCPHCKEWAPLEWVHSSTRELLCADFLKAAPADYVSVVWDKSAQNIDGSWNIAKVRETAHYVCPHNGCPITDTEKVAMLPHYEQHRQNVQADTDNRSFRVPSFYAPSTTFGDMAIYFLGKGEQGDLLTSALQVFYNHYLALPWTVMECNVRESHLAPLQIDCPRGQIPWKPELLVLTADPGQMRTHWGLVAIRKDGALHYVDWGTVMSPELLLSADFLRARQARVKGTEEILMPHRAFIDSRYEPDRIFTLCTSSRGFMWPVRGVNTGMGTWSQMRVATHPGLFVYNYNDTQLKDELYGARFARRREPGVTLPSDIDSDLIIGLTGQQKNAINGEWKRLLNDDLGDCLKYGLLASMIGRPLLA